tara:strand:+ start:241 stop:585 length:345 start_codon:yes stop_codon:yes gene_type:complete
MKQINIKIYGRVQGVGFRVFVKDKADSLKLKGFVMNRNDGSVLIIAQGVKEKLEELLRAVKKGPTLSKVGDVDVSWGESKEKFRDFKIRKTDSFIVDQKNSFVNLGKEVLNLKK